MATTLTIAHNLFLTREEIYNYFSGDEIEVIGVSIPVWLADGETSEPAVEVFAKYRLMHTKEKILIKHNKQKYEIYIPKTPSYEPPYISNDMWQSLNEEEKEKYYGKLDREVTIKNLLDIKDGGSEWLAFKQYSKSKKDKKTLNVIHYVEIKKIEDLLISLA
jgi:hypothetical protein